jgi:hypothetical protein
MDWKEKLALAYGKETPKFLNKNPNKIPQRHTGRHALKPYLGIVTYPISRGGGIGWLKSAVALRNYEKQGCKVVWL